jgi:hypothetical protein
MTRERSIRRIHWAAGFIACIGIPAASWIFDSGLLAWTMYTGAHEYRLDVTALEASGDRRPVNPTALAAGAAPSVVALLGGSDHWRSGFALLVRSHLDGIATRACSEGTAEAVEVVMHERSAGHGERVTTRTVRCAR